MVGGAGGGGDVGRDGDVRRARLGMDARPGMGWSAGREGGRRELGLALRPHFSGSGPPRLGALWLGFFVTPASEEKFLGHLVVNL